MNFDNQGIVSGTFLRQMGVLLLVDGTIYFTETCYKMHCITMEYTTPRLLKLKLYKKKKMLDRATKLGLWLKRL